MNKLSGGVRLPGSRETIGRVKGGRRGIAQRRRFRMPAKLRWSDMANEKSIDEHGYEAGKRGQWRVSNPTRGDPARLRWLVAWEQGRIEGGWPIDGIDYSDRAA